MAMNLNPFVLIAGTLAAPIVMGAAGRAVLKFDEAAPNHEAELRSLITKFALLNAATAAGLGYAYKKSSTDTWKSAALGGAIGTALIAGVLGSTVLFTPAAPPAQQPPPPGALPAGAPAPSTWVSNLVGYPARI
jgi:hypothetical protein